METSFPRKRCGLTPSDKVHNEEIRERTEAASTQTYYIETIQLSLYGPLKGSKKKIDT